MSTLTNENGGVEYFQLVRVAYALALDVKGIPQSRGSVMNLAKKYCGSPKRTKRGVLIDYVTFLTKRYPEWKPQGTIRSAMEKPVK